MIVWRAGIHPLAVPGTNPVSAFHQFASKHYRPYTRDQAAAPDDCASKSSRNSDAGSTPVMIRWSRARVQAT